MMDVYNVPSYEFVGPIHRVEEIPDSTEEAGVVCSREAEDRKIKANAPLAGRVIRDANTETSRNAIRPISCPERTAAPVQCA
jgi:hypothetical protein